MGDVRIAAGGRGTVIFALVWAIAPVIFSQTPPATQSHNRAELLKIKPNISGLFGPQIEGTRCKVSFSDLWLKKID